MSAAVVGSVGSGGSAKVKELDSDSDNRESLHASWSLPFSKCLFVMVIEPKRKLSTRPGAKSKNEHMERGMRVIGQKGNCFLERRKIRKQNHNNLCAR